MRYPSAASSPAPRQTWTGPAILEGPQTLAPDPLIDAPRPPSLPERVARLRAHVRTYGTLDEAAASLGVRPGTLRRNLNRDSATAGALDVIEENLALAHEAACG